MALMFSFRATFHVCYFNTFGKLITISVCPDNMNMHFVQVCVCVQEYE